MYSFDCIAVYKNDFMDNTGNHKYMMETLHGASTGMIKKPESQQLQGLASPNKAIMPASPYKVRFRLSGK